MVNATNQQGMPIFIGEIVAGNHNDLFEVLGQFKKLVYWCVGAGIKLKGVVVNMDKGFDSKALRRFCFRQGLVPNVKENVRNRKKPKRGSAEESEYLTKQPIKTGWSVNERGRGTTLFAPC